MSKKQAANSNHNHLANKLVKNNTTVFQHVIEKCYVKQEIQMSGKQLQIVYDSRNDYDDK